jgi:hypothetical protein
MGKSSKAPNPVSTTAQQNELNRTNQSGPFGSLTYNQTGTNPDGTPIYTANASLSPQEQGLYSQIGQANPALDPNNLESQFTQQQGHAYDASMSYLQPQFDQQTGQLKDQLQQQGITEESNPTAYNNAMTLNNNTQGFARQQALDSSYEQGLQGENQQFNQGVTESNLPISQLSTLYGLNNLNGQTNSNTLSQLATNKGSMDQASSNNTTSGLTSLAATAAMAFMMY